MGLSMAGFTGCVEMEVWRERGGGMERSKVVFQRKPSEGLLVGRGRGRRRYEGIDSELVWWWVA